MKLLFVGNNDADARLVSALLAETPAGASLEHARGLDDAVPRLRATTFDALLLDLELSDARSMPLLLHPVEAARPVPVIVVTSPDGERLAEEALRAGAQDYLVKGRFGAEMLARAIRHAAERRRAADEILRLHRELDRRVAERTAELAAANRELETFAYSVSHDLRAPLRSIDGFTSIVLREGGAGLDEKSRAHLESVRQAGQRMTELIDSLLQLSRATRADLRRKPVDLASLARTVVEDLQRAEPGRSVAWQCAPRMPAVGDPILLRAVLENLLGNAWKFTRRTPAPRIDFGVETQAGETVFRVRDNGAGFDMARADRLFGAFQRLHTSEDYPGTGIGLATAQRIVRRHGGRIWAEAAVNAGASFFFTLAPPPAST